MIYKRIYNWSVFLTALASFGVWNLVNLIETITGLDDNLLLIIKFVVGAFFSYGFFTGIVSTLYWLIEEFKPIKKLFFASSYIEGVWLCSVITKDNELGFTVHQIEQTSDEISIYGQKFDYNNGNPISVGSLSSTGATFDNKKHLNFTYTSYNREVTNAGFASFQFTSRGKKAPDEFNGFNANYSTNEKRIMKSIKHYDFEEMPDFKIIVEKVKEFYDGHKELFYNNSPVTKKSWQKRSNYK